MWLVSKRTFWHVCTRKTQINLRISAVRSKSLLSTCRNFTYLVIQSDDSGQTSWSESLLDAHVRRYVFFFFHIWDHILTLTTLYMAVSADDNLVIFFLFFLENRIWHFIQIVSLGSVRSYFLEKKTIYIYIYIYITKCRLLKFLPSMQSVKFSLLGEFIHLSNRRWMSMWYNFRINEPLAHYKVIFLCFVFLLRYQFYSKREQILFQKRTKSFLIELHSLP